jgi:hypothetical protein
MKTPLNMKKFTLLSFGLMVLLSSFTGQSGIDDVITALKSGNASGISRYFDSYIDITLPDKSSNYSKSQGELIIKDFFSNTGVKNFEVKHKGDNDNGEYCIGTLQTRNGNYRTTVYMRVKGSKQVIQDIRIQQL